MNTKETLSKSKQSDTSLVDQYREKSKQWFRTDFQRQVVNNVPIAPHGSSQNEHTMLAQQWVESYRLFGYCCANLSPIKQKEKITEPTTEFNYWGLKADFQIPSFGLLPSKTVSVQQLNEKLRSLYNGKIGIEVDHIRNREERNWLINQFEKGYLLTPELKLKVYNKLLCAEILEKHLHNNFVGQKRFSLEGTDSLIPLLDRIIHICNNHGIEELIIGMAHRGRLNVITNIMGKPPATLFAEFGGTFETGAINGDVKYHLGFSSTLKLNNGTTHLVLAFNPSHLEIINPVILGSTRARQERYPENERYKIIPVIIHGDAAFSGQGVVMESLNMSQTRGFGVKGSIHIIVNNQIGFTIDNPQDSRSTLYSSDPARFIGAPIIHVNADDPDSVIRAGVLAVAYRQRYFKDVVIDMIGYRRHGHNEADDPSVTQPLTYKEIKAKPTVISLYKDRLINEGTFEPDFLEEEANRCRKKIENGESTVEGIEYITDTNNKRLLTWRKYLNIDNKSMVKPFIQNKSKNDLIDISEKMSVLPTDFTAHRQVKKIYDNRQLMASGKLPIDWGFAENLAYASLLSDGYGIRLTGQDVKRGTFFHRHSVVIDQKTGDEYNALSQFINSEQTLDIYDSLLSEEAVLGYEYGYSTAEPETLLIWEAQFGDFANGAQVVIDQFISSGESKWERLSGLVMLLPHGFEGQGPEHSSARIERYIQLCAQYNMQVVIPTTPAQIFHLLRRQVLRVLRKPLIVMSPKSLLRHPGAVSTLDELSSGGFKYIIDDPETNKSVITKLVICSGKIYYQLLELKNKLKKENIAIVRIEQLYPFPHIEYKNTIKNYPNIKSAIWCQEEPKNQGAWYNIRHQLVEPLEKIGINIQYVGRDTSASPAVGLASIHNKQQEQIIKEVFEEN